MKRSDMVNIITCELQDRVGNGFNSQFTDEEFACVLLQKLEEQGMLPPKISNVEILPSNNNYMTLNAALTAGLNQWEPEDDGSQEDL